MIQKLMNTCTIGLYIHKQFTLHIGCLDTGQINNQTIIHFVNLWSKVVPINSIYQSIINPIDVYLDAHIGPNSIRYIITMYKSYVVRII